jgi:hypothetical protein
MSMRSQEFPIEVKRGSVTVRIRRVCPSKTYPDHVLFALDYHEDGKRQRPSFGTLKEARKCAEDDMIVQVEVEPGQPAFERGRDFGGLVPVGAHAARRLERHAEAAQPHRLGLERDVLQVFLGQRDDILVAFGFGRGFGSGVSGLIFFAAPGAAAIIPMSAAVFRV